MFTWKSTLMLIGLLLLTSLPAKQARLGEDIPNINITNAKRVKELQVLYDKPNTSLDNLVFSPDGDILAFIEGSSESHSEGVVHFWDVDEIKESPLLVKQPLSATTIAFSPDSTLFATGDAKGNLVVVDTHFANSVMKLNVEASPINAITIPPGNQLIAYASGFKDFKESYAFRFIEIATGKEFFNLPFCEDSGCPGAGLNIVFRSSGDLFTTATDDGKVRLWDGETKEEIAALEDYSKEADNLLFTPDGTQVVYGATDGIRIWNIKTALRKDGKKDDFRVIAQPAEGEFIQSIALNPDGTVLAAGYLDGSIKLWNVETGEQLTILEGHIDRVVSLAFSPDGTLLASGGTDGTVRLWGMPGE